MKLLNEFEIVTGDLLNMNYVPLLITCLGKLLIKKQRLLTQGAVSHKFVSSEHVLIANVFYNRGKVHDIRHIQCFSCKHMGHVAHICKNMFFNYFK